MRVLVTGASGYIGTVLARALSARGHTVTAAARRCHVEGASRSVIADVRDIEAMRVIVRDVDAVCHLAAIAGVRQPGVEVGLHASVNIGGTVALLKALAEQSSTRRTSAAFVYASSACVYGGLGRGCVAETSPTEPTTAYGASKLAAERAVRRYSLAGLVAGVSLRLFNVAGAHEGHGDANTDRIVPKILDVAAGRRDALPVQGDGLGIHDFVHVADVADAFARALEVAHSHSYQVLNVGACPASISELILAAQKVTGRTIPTTTSPSNAAAVRMWADTSLIRNRFSWRPARSSVEEILVDAWAAHRSGALQAAG